MWERTSGTTADGGSKTLAGKHKTKCRRTAYMQDYIFCDKTERSKIARVELSLPKY